MGGKVRKDKKANHLSVQRAKLELYIETGTTPTQQEVADHVGLALATVQNHWHHEYEEVNTVAKKFNHEIPTILQEMVQVAKKEGTTRAYRDLIKVLGWKEETNATIHIPQHQQTIEVEYIDAAEETDEATPAEGQ